MREKRRAKRTDTSSLSVLSVSFGYERELMMVQTKFISLSRFWYTILIVLIQTILIICGIKQCYINDSLSWPKSISFPRIELFVQKICLLTSLVLLIIFIYPSLFRIHNFANDQRQLTFDELEKKWKRSICSIIWHHFFSLSTLLHLLMSFLIIISSLLIDAKQILAGFKDSGSLWRTDLDFLFDWSLSSLSSSIPTPKRLLTNTTLNLHSIAIESYSRLSLINFLFASFICVIREPAVFWSISKIFSTIYSFALALNVIQWSLMYGAFQLLLKNICFHPIDSTHRVGYLLIGQPYTAFFLYLLLEFLIYISSITFYYYGYNRFKSSKKKFTCYDRCSHYCPSLIAIVLLLLYTSCKMPLVHDIFLLYVQTRLKILLITFIFEIVHVLIILALWIFLTTKVDWHVKRSLIIEKERQMSPVSSSHGLTVKNTPIQPTAISLPELSGTCTSSSDKASRRLSDNLYQKPYEKIRIFQSEIYYHDRPKNWSLPPHQQPSMIATFDQDDDESTDLVVRSPSYPLNQTKTNPNGEIQYRDAIRKTVSNIYKSSNHENTSSTPPIPPIKRFTQEQVEAARLRAQQLIIQRQRSPEYAQHHRSAALLISQV